MRDPKRIDIILSKIKHIWKHHPDLRLFQLLINPTNVSCAPLYYMEDEHLLKILNYYNKE